MRVKWGNAAMLLGVAGAVVIGAASTAAALAYVGAAGQRYSPLNHFVSELGEVGVSPWADVFNLALIVGGACIAACLTGIACMLPRRLGIAFGVVGLIAGLSGTLVGAFPMNNFGPHALAAVTFFHTGWIAVALFSAHVYFSRDCPHPRWLAYAGLPCIAAFLAFIVQIPAVPLERLATPSAGRPEFWPFTLAEWLVIACVLLWVVVVALGLRRGTAGETEGV
jgi:hypothetical membrane protein